MSERHVAQRLGVPRATLNDWSRAQRDATLGVATLGRPRQREPRRVRAEVLELIEETRGRIGVATIHRAFPDVSRSRLRRMLRAYRRRHRHRPATLTWTRPGTVWAADFTDVTGLGLIDGTRRHMLIVRDLASGLQLAAVPACHATAERVVAVLRGLFASHGPPLVLKTDNGSHFTAGILVELLRAHGVHQLRSPLEAGIGAIKVRLLDGFPEDAVLTADDVERARAQGNAAVCPRRRTSAEERWARRHGITHADRTRFNDIVEAQRDRHRELLTAQEPTIDLEHDLNVRAMVARRSIRDALCAAGYLFIKRSHSANTSTKPNVDSSGT